MIEQSHTTEKFDLNDKYPNENNFNTNRIINPKQGFNSALFLTPPKFDSYDDNLETPIKDLGEKIGQLKLDSNDSFTSGSKGISKLSGIKNCISKDLLQRLEESSPISINHKPLRFNDSMVKRKMNTFCDEIEEEGTLNNENETHDSSEHDEVKSRILNDITKEINNKNNFYQNGGINIGNNKNSNTKGLNGSLSNGGKEENYHYLFNKENLNARFNQPFSTGMSKDLKDKIFVKGSYSEILNQELKVDYEKYYYNEKPGNRNNTNNMSSQAGLSNNTNHGSNYGYNMQENSYINNYNIGIIA